MSDLFDFDASPDRYAVMGNPIAHSKSPQIHAAFAQQTHQRLHYEAVLVEPGTLPQAVGNFAANGGKGLNITVPFKREAWELSDSLSERARLAGAVNTLIVNKDTIHGDNTDGVGLVRDLILNNTIKLSDCRILLLGAGGAARGVLGPLLEENPQRLLIANRTADRATALAEDFAALGSIEGSGLSALDGQQFDLIINATAASLHGELPPLPDGLIADGGCCYDMMYAAEPTVFMRWSKEQGARQIMDGLGMLVEQAAESFFLWRNVRPETAPVIQQIRQSLAN